MAIIKRLSKKEIRENYTHYALAYGIYPVYIAGGCDCCNGDVSVAVRNWLPDWGLALADEIAYIVNTIAGKENMFMFKIIGEINNVR